VYLPLVIRGIPIIPLDPTEPPVMVVMRALSLLGTPLFISLAGLALALALEGTPPAHPNSRWGGAAQRAP
jgi:hypothetical protein